MSPFLRYKPLLNHLLEKVLLADDDDTDLTKEMKVGIKVDLQLDTWILSLIIYLKFLHFWILDSSLTM